MTTSLQREISPKGLSARGKIWRVKSKEELNTEILSAALGEELVAHLLQSRSISSGESAKAFLDPDHYTATSPMELPDVDKAIARIKQAISNQEHITVFGDYDVDGITGTSVLLTVLRHLGASVDFYIPNRAEEGYGLNLKALSILASRQRTKLIITCDCGVSNFAEVNFGKSLGVDTLILDHHSMPELLPPAVGIVHPKLLPEDHPLFHLPGVGVAYKVCEALLIDMGSPERVPALLDYVTLGMIADLVPLIRENRYLVQIGLPRLLNSEKPGIQALLSQVRKSDGSTDVVGFGLAPRINAVGRLADAKVAVELLTTEDASVAEQLAHQLQLENTKRQEICEQIFLEADQMIASRIDLEKDKGIVIYKSNWHHGVVGIVASRLVEKYNRPVFIGEENHGDGLVRGSARSVDAIDLYAVLKANEQLLHKWGGHKMAAGFSVAIDKAKVLSRAIVDTCNKMQPDALSAPVLDIDLPVSATEVDLKMVTSFAKLAPFGMANKKPVFLLKQVRSLSERLLGKEGKHVRLNLLHDETGINFEAVIWNYQNKAPSPDSIIDIAFVPECNSYNGRDRLQLIVLDWRYTQEPDSTVLSDTFRSKAVAAATSVIEELKAVVSDNEPDSVLESAQQISAAVRPAEKIAARPCTWRDLRDHRGSTSVLSKALEKFGKDLGIFAESFGKPNDFEVLDRSTINEKSHLLLWQYPPSLKVFQELVQRVSPGTVYLVGGAPEEAADISAFLKKLMALVRYAVSKRDGQIEGDKLSAALATTKLAAALGMSLLQKVGAIDWFAEDGLIYVDLAGSPTASFDEFPEYKQLSDSLQQVDLFRQWCSTATLKDIQLAVMPNQIRLAVYPTTDSSDATNGAIESQPAVPALNAAPNQD
jgi:single-stranded-DNA-specific exonuclease RecJ